MNPYSKPHPGIAAVSFFLIAIHAASSPSIRASGSPTIYEILPRFGLPGGLLPDTVTSFSFSEGGDFTVDLQKPCYIQFEYLVYYDCRITGKLSYGSITDLEGIQVKKLFIWFSVSEIRVDLPPSGSIYFQVGLFNKRLNVTQFETLHSCSDEVATGCDQSREEGGLQGRTVDDIQMVPAE